MPRKPAKEVEEKRRKALEMDSAGSTPAEIARVVERNVKTVKAWLRDIHGTTGTFKEKLEDCLARGMSVEQAAEHVGCSLAHARRIERESRGYLKVPHRTTVEVVAGFLASPESETSRSSRSDSFCRELLSHVYRVVDRDPVAAGEVIDVVVERFEMIHRSARSRATIQRASCNLNIAKAMRAARERILSRPGAALEIIRAIDSGDCQACEAELSRREGRILCDLKRFPMAISRLLQASHIYRQLGNSGHDVLRNGLGTCAINECAAHYLNGSPGVAVVVAERGLRLVEPTETTLFLGLRFNKLLALLDLSDPQVDAIDLAETLLAECGEDSSVPRLRCAFLAGRAAELSGDFKAAFLHYSDAYEDAQELRLASGVGALLADIARVEPPDPECLRDRIERLQDQGHPWLTVIGSALTQVYRTADQDLAAALKAFRRATGGDKLLPHSAAMAIA